MSRCLRAGLLALAVAALVASGLPVHATILFAGGEDVDITLTGAGAIWETGNGYRGTFARTAIMVQNSTTVADPPANRATTPTFTAGSTVWVHAQLFPTINTTTSGEQALILRSPDGVSRIILRQTGTAGTLKASTRNAAGTITDLATATGTYAAATQIPLDLQVVYGCTSGDQVNLWLNGIQVIAFTGSSICTDAATQLNQVDFASVNNGGSTNAATCANGGIPASCWSEVIVANVSTLGTGLWTLQPAAAGNTQSWTPNTVADVNPTTINDTNFVTTGTNSALSEWTTPTAVPSGTWAVLAIVQSARVLRGTSGPQNFDFLMRTKDGSDHLGGYSSTVSTSFGNFTNFIWATNPHTGSAFTTTDVASGFNLGIESLP